MEYKKKNKKNNKKKKIVVAVSGGFDPIHIGHIRLFQEAKKLGDRLVVILNNDHWLRKKKGKEFMPAEERKEIIEALECVDEVFISEHTENSKDVSVCNELLKIKPHIFANGGDRKPENNDLPPLEYKVCNDLGIKMVFNVGHGGKVRSSSELLKEYSKKTKNQK
jgi:cytidyltransferase-like protein